MEIIAESARLKFEIDAKEINDYLQSYIPDALLTIQQSGKIVLTGKISVIPFRLIVNEIKNDQKHIFIVLDSGFLSIISSLVLKYFKVDYLNFSLQNKKLDIDIYKFIKSNNITIPLYPNIDGLTIEKCFIQDRKIILAVTLFGENNISQIITRA